MSAAEQVEIPSQSSDHTFRDDIQGLRGIAVGLVLLFHASIPGFSGGFVGVDIFFVLSGFLITGNLIREIHTHGQIRFKEFYARRIRRLLPAAFLVLIATLIAAAIWFPPLLMPGIAVDIASAGLYVSNMDFAIRATDYFASSVIPSPVLHFWSLGVEEQFYLFWPILLAVATWHKKTQIARFINARIFLLSSLVFTGSLSFAHWLLPHNQPWAFFSLPTRAWELILGALLAAAHPLVIKFPRYVLTLCGIAGLVTVLVSGLTQSDPLKFPSTPALLPTLGALLVLAGGVRGPRGIATRLLQFKPITYLGKISYSLYLWHWPVLVIPQVLAVSKLRLLERLGLALIAIILAALTERCVELPFKRGFVIGTKPMRNIAIAGVIASLLAVTSFSADYAATGSLRNKKETGSAADLRNFMDSLVIQSTPVNTVPSRPATVDFPIPADLEPNLLSANQDRPITYADHCHTQMNLKPSTQPCIYGDTTSSTEVVLFGDSHALAWFPAFNQVAKEEHWKLLSLTMSACSAADIPAYNPGTGSLMQNCGIWRQASIQKIIAAHPYLVLVASTSGFATAQEGVEIRGMERTSIFVDGMNRTLTQLKGSGAKVVLMSDTPAMAKDPLVCLSAHPKSTLACATPVSEAISDDWISVETQIAAHNGVPLIKPQMWVCPTSPCPVVIGKILTYIDTGHMTATFSQALAGRLKSALLTALAPTK
jgi:peptidoglycan/LPS O-acetylase OafA/YrhL